MDALFVEKDLPEVITLPHMQEHTLGKNHLDVLFVVGNSVKGEIALYT